MISFTLSKNKKEEEAVQPKTKKSKKSNENKKLNKSIEKKEGGLTKSGMKTVWCAHAGGHTEHATMSQAPSFQLIKNLHIIGGQGIVHHKQLLMQERG